MDLQCDMRANYNASPCDDEGKGAGARTMENNGKNNAKNNGNGLRSWGRMTAQRAVGHDTGSVFGRARNDGGMGRRGPTRIRD